MASTANSTATADAKATSTNLLPFSAEDIGAQLNLSKDKVDRIRRGIKRELAKPKPDEEFILEAKKLGESMSWATAHEMRHDLKKEWSNGNRDFDREWAEEKRRSKKKSRALDGQRETLVQWLVLLEEEPVSLKMHAGEDIETIKELMEELLNRDKLGGHSLAFVMFKNRNCDEFLFCFESVL